ncbi:MAG: hypothetical protein JRH20_21870 [Deltaproteobacteria bacterium]|nr:hypothetical protein [Deltaproteobacteria bacterium]
MVHKTALRIVDLAVMLYRRGAEVVGVASSQAGNCFIDSLGYTLSIWP